MSSNFEILIFFSGAVSCLRNGHRMQMAPKFKLGIMQICYLHTLTINFMYDNLCSSSCPTYFKNKGFLGLLLLDYKRYSQIGTSSQLITTQSRPKRKHGNRKRHNKSYHEYVTEDFLKDIFATNGLRLLSSLLYSIPHYLLSKFTRKFLNFICAKKFQNLFISFCQI